MDPGNLAISMQNLEYGRADDEDADETSIRDLLLGVVYRRMGQLDKTKELLEKVMGAPAPKNVTRDDIWMGMLLDPDVGAVC